MENTQKNNENKGTGIPENNPSKAMDSKREVENSPDKKTDEDFPGYPHYPAKEDVIQQGKDLGEEVDVENLPTSGNDTGVSQRFTADTNNNGTQEGITPVQPRDKNEENRSGDNDSLTALRSKDDEIGTPQNVTNEELKNQRIPGSNPDKREPDNKRP